MKSIGEVADKLGVTVATVRVWEKTGKIKAIRTPGGHRRFKEESTYTRTGKFYDYETDSLIQMTPQEERVHALMCGQSIESLADSVIRHHRKYPETYQWKD
jgi:excisionase family DNA binding protein